MRWSIPFDQQAEETLFRSLCGGAIISLAEETGDSGDLVELRKALVDRVGVRQWLLTRMRNPLYCMEMQQGRPERVYNAPGAATDGLTRYPVVACRILGGGGALQQFKRSRSVLVSAFV